MTLPAGVQGRADLSQLALDIGGQPHPAAMISRITQLGATLIAGVAADLIQVTGSGQLRVASSSDPALSELTGKIWRRWPHTTIAQGGAADDQRARSQRRHYLQQLRTDTGIVQELILPLVAGDNDHGYLRFLCTGSEASTADRMVLTAFCAHAEIALDRAALLTQVANLRVALESNRVIGAAVGVLMTRHQLSYPDALHRLKSASQNTNRLLRHLAADVLYTGELPAPTRTSATHPRPSPPRSSTPNALAAYHAPDRGCEAGDGAGVQEFARRPADR